MRKTKLPDKPGVYMFLDKKGNILYVGRATSLKRRVASYFRNDIDPENQRDGRIGGENQTHCRGKYFGNIYY